MARNSVYGNALSHLALRRRLLQRRVGRGVRCFVESLELRDYARFRQNDGAGRVESIKGRCTILFHFMLKCKYSQRGAAFDLNGIAPELTVGCSTSLEQVVMHVIHQSHRFRNRGKARSILHIATNRVQSAPLECMCFRDAFHVGVIHR